MQNINTKQKDSTLNAHALRTRFTEHVSYMACNTRKRTFGHLRKFAKRHFTTTLDLVLSRLVVNRKNT